MKRSILKGAEMKKCLILLLSFSMITSSIYADIFDDIGKGTKKAGKKIGKGTKKAAKTVEEKVFRPVVKTLQVSRKIAKDAALDALKSVGININGIVSNVNAIKSTIPKISFHIASTQRAIRAPRSPVTQAAPISARIKAFRAKVDTLQKKVKAPEIKSALSSPEGLSNLLKKVVSSSTQKQIRDTQAAYDALVTKLDEVEINPILIPGRKTLLNMAGLIDSALRIRDFSGALAKDIIPGNLASALRNISGSLRAVTANLNDIIQGGRRSMRSAMGDLAGGLLSNLKNISTLSRSLQNVAKGIPPEVNQLKIHVAHMMKLRSQLVKTATTIDSRLEKLILKKMRSVIGTLDIPRAAIVELKNILGELRGYLKGILAQASDAIARAAAVALLGVNGIDAFRKNIGFDVVPPRSRKGFVELPGNTRGLSQNVDRLRRALL